MRRAFLSCLLALALPVGALAQATAPTAAQTVEVGGAKIDTATELSGQKLVLNGAGVRYRAIFKVYAIGLYAKAKAETPDALIKMDGAKRLTLKMLRDVDGKDLGKAFTDGMQKNMVGDEKMKALNGIFKFGKMFQDIKRVNTGTVITLDWIPGTGTQVVIDGKQAGDTIVEPEFYSAVMRIWLGEDPADDKLKSQLLGTAGR